MSQHPSFQQHPSYQSRLRRAASGQDQPEVTPESAASRWSACRDSSRACCCSARPAVIAVMPARNGRPAPTDVLLCGHHYRQSRPALAAGGAMLLDIWGYPLAPGTWPEPRY